MHILLLANDRSHLSMKYGIEYNLVLRIIRWGTHFILVSYMSYTMLCILSFMRLIFLLSCEHEYLVIMYIVLFWCWSWNSVFLICKMFSQFSWGLPFTWISHSHFFVGVLDIPMISWVVMLVSRLLDYVATVEDEAAATKKPLNGKDRERFLTGITSL